MSLPPYQPRAPWHCTLKECNELIHVSHQHIYCWRIKPWPSRPRHDLMHTDADHDRVWRRYALLTEALEEGVSEVGFSILVWLQWKQEIGKLH